MLLSVITVCLNSEKTLRKTLESVLSQTYTEIEYIVIDGLSSDQTPEILRKYRERFQKRNIAYTVLSEKDNGIYDAMNKGIRLARGELIGIINSDDWYEPDALQTAAEQYQKNPFEYFFADIRLVKANGQVLTKRSKVDRFPSSRHWNHPTCFVKKALYEELGLFRCEGIHDDYDFYLRVRRANRKIAVLNRVLANFSVGGVSNQKTFAKCKKRCMDRYACYKNNGYSRLYFLECVAIEAAKCLLS